MCGDRQPIRGIPRHNKKASVQANALRVAPVWRKMSHRQHFFANSFITNSAVPWLTVSQNFKIILADHSPAASSPAESMEEIEDHQVTQPAFRSDPQRSVRDHT